MNIALAALAVAVMLAALGLIGWAARAVHRAPDYVPPKAAEAAVPPVPRPSATAVLAAAPERPAIEAPR